MKFRGRVLVQPTGKLLDTYAGKAGIAYDEDWTELNEVFLHREDWENLYIHCARKHNGGPLILHKVECLGAIL